MKRRTSPAWAINVAATVQGINNTYEAQGTAIAEMLTFDDFRLDLLRITGNGLVHVPHRGVGLPAHRSEDQGRATRVLVREVFVESPRGIGHPDPAHFPDLGRVRQAGDVEHHELAVAPIVLTLIITAVVAVGVALAWFLVGRPEVPRVAPAKVSVFTRAARADLYGDAVNEAVFMRPGDRFVTDLVRFDDHGVDGAVDGTAAAFGGMSTRLRRWQTGFVRSYALSLLAGAVLVLAVLLAVNLA